MHSELIVNYDLRHRNKNVKRVQEERGVYGVSSIGMSFCQPMSQFSLTEEFQCWFAVAESPVVKFICYFSYLRQYLKHPIFILI